MFWKNMLPPSSEFKSKPSINQHEVGRVFHKQITWLAACFMVASCLAFSSALKMEGTYSSETSVGFHWTTRQYIPEDRTLSLKLVALYGWSAGKFSVRRLKAD
jgi:hypothetical protein